MSKVKEIENRNNNVAKKEEVVADDAELAEAAKAAHAIAADILAERAEKKKNRPQDQKMSVFGQIYLPDEINIHTVSPLGPIGPSTPCRPIFP